jgi:hypothetical protein
LADSVAILLTQVFAASGLDQAIERVVGVVVARLDALIPEVVGLLRVVLDVDDVAGGVVGVVQVLHLAARPAGNGGLRVVAGKRGRIALRFVSSWVRRKVSGS